jgi:hypothetical protein
LENATKTHYANVNRKKSGNLGINELKKLIRTDKQATDILEILNRLKAGEKKVTFLFVFKNEKVLAKCYRNSVRF